LKTPAPKLCIHCKHFIPNKYNSKNGKCSFFPKENENVDFLVNGLHEKDEQEYYLCSSSRYDENKCGKMGKHFQLLKTNKKINPGKKPRKIE